MIRGDRYALCSYPELRLNISTSGVLLPLKDAEQIGESISPLHADPATGRSVVGGYRLWPSMPRVARAPP
jgi:hypothetical protein